MPSLTCDRCLDGRHRCARNRRCMCRRCKDNEKPPVRTKDGWRIGGTE